MAKIGISETQFAFMFFHKFSSLFEDSFARMIVPNTVQEGQNDYDFRGTDLVLDNYFIQFKLPKYISKSNLILSKYPKDFKDKSYFWFEAYNGKNGHGQYDFLRAHCKKEGNHVWYVSPSFNDSQYNTVQEDDNYWFKNFYRSSPSDLKNHIFIADVHDIEWEWVNNSKHFLAQSHLDSTYYAYSKRKESSKFNLGNHFETKHNRYLNKKHLTIDEVISEIKKYFLKKNGDLEKDDSFNSINTVTELQLFILYKYEVFWIPFCYNSNESFLELANAINSTTKGTIIFDKGLKL